MSSMWAVLAFAAAAVGAGWLLHHFGTFRWYWHLLSIAVALAIGLAPTPPALINPASELITGVVFLFLVVWGIGGILLFRPHQAKHHERHA